MKLLLKRLMTNSAPPKIFAAARAETVAGDEKVVAEKGKVAGDGICAGKVVACPKYIPPPPHHHQDF